jgi:TetR/AcrR family transcriptional regulator, tetracycline repressor protein
VRQGPEQLGAPATRPPGRPATLHIDAIIAAAIEIIDEFGLEGCTIRAVADRLGSSPMSLYRHVADKHALLAQVPDVLLESVAASVVRRRTPVTALRAVADGLAEVLLAHPGLARLFDQPQPGKNMQTAAQHCVELLISSGRTPEQAFAILRAIVAQVVGEVITSHGNYDATGVELLLSTLS